MISTIYAWQSDPLNIILKPFRSYHLNSAHALIDYIFLHFFYNNFPLYGSRVFEDHNILIKNLVPEDKLLVFEAREGWAPLCAFLGKEVPEGPYPKLHDTRDFREHLIENRWLGIKRTLGVVGFVGVLIPVLVGWGVWSFGFRGLLKGNS